MTAQAPAAKIYTFGYSRQSVDALARRIDELGAVLIDIRFSPHESAEYNAVTAEREGAALSGDLFAVVSE